MNLTDTSTENKIYGYVRVSTKEQNENRQLIAMKNFGIVEKKYLYWQTIRQRFQQTGL